jgi:hypothetical protein
VTDLTTWRPSVPRNDSWSMDLRHVRAIRWLVETYRPAAVLEIGSFEGYSSEALLVPGVAVHLCDTFVRDSVRRLAERPGVDVTIHECGSLEAIEKTRCPWVVVDGSHDLETVVPEVELLEGTPTVIAHDTNATAAGYARCEGAMFLREHFGLDGRYRCFEDRAYRAGERTERGLFVATREDLDFEALAGVVGR